MVLLTGASGFVGKHLLKELISKYGRNNVLALTSAPISDANYILHDNYQFDCNNQLFSKVKTIIHGGAFIPKISSEANNWKECNSNIINTQKLLLCNYPLLKNIIYLSTVDVYGNESSITEFSPTDPASLYGSSKLYCEKMVRNWADQQDVNCIILRLGHIYGPGEEIFKKIIPIAFKKILRGENLQIWGTGTEIRTFIFITDLVYSILKSIDLYEKAILINVVGGTKISIRELLEKMLEITRSSSQIEYFEASHVARNLVFDNSKLVKYLLHNETSLTEGLTREWNYFRSIR